MRLRELAELAFDGDRAIGDVHFDAGRALESVFCLYGTWLISLRLGLTRLVRSFDTCLTKLRTTLRRPDFVAGLRGR